MTTRWVAYVFENGCFIEEVDHPELLPEVGDWTRPFPAGEDSAPFGMEERFFQSDWMPAHDAWGELVRVVVSNSRLQVDVR